MSDETPLYPESPPTSLTTGPFTLGDAPCAQCNYNLRGLRSDGKCPECGTPIWVSLPDVPSFATKPEVDTALDRAIPCTRCGVLLQNQTTHGDCPNCGAPVWGSIYGAWLRASDPDWLRRVRSGITLWLCMILVTFVLGVAVGVGAMVWGVVNSAGGQALNQAALQKNAVLVGSATGVIVAILSAFVAWRITTINPGDSLRDSKRNLRGFVRGVVVLIILVTVGNVAVAALDAPMWLQMALGGLGVVGVGATVGMLLFLSDFAARIPRPKLEHACVVVAWGTGVTTAIAQAGAVAMMPYAEELQAIGQGGGGSPGAAVPGASFIAAGCVFGLAGIVGLAFLIWLVVLLFKFRTAFGRAINQASPELAHHAAP